MTTEQIVLDSGEIAGTWTTFTNQGYNAVWTKDRTGTSGRLHHISFAVDSRDDIIRAADLALEHGIHIETGPHKHTIQQSFFLYVWEPGRQPDRAGQPGRPAGLRARLAADRLVGGRARQGPGLGAARPSTTFHTHGTPPVRRRRSDPAHRGPRARRGGVGDRARPGRGGRRRPRLRPAGRRRRRGPAARQRGRRGGRRRPGAQRQQLPRRHDGAGERARRRCAPARCGPTSTPPVPG